MSVREVKENEQGRCPKCRHSFTRDELIEVIQGFDTQSICKVELNCPSCNVDLSVHLHLCSYVDPYAEES